MKNFMLIAILALAGGCTTEQRAAEDDATCRSYGAKPGTPIYVECRMRQQELREARRARAAATGPRFCQADGLGGAVCF
jgi:hypothetical protein